MWRKFSAVKNHCASRDTILYELYLAHKISPNPAPVRGWGDGNTGFKINTDALNLLSWVNI